MDINIYVLLGLVFRVVSILMLLILVLPKQMFELKRPKNEFTPLRWLLFGIVVIYITLTMFPMSYLISRIDSPSTLNLQNLSSIATNVGNFALSAIIVTIYRYPVKRGK